MIRYGKASAPLIMLKQSFFSDNEELLEECRRIADLYASQPRRTRCKICEGDLGKPVFSKQGIDYIFCSKCKHLNGAYEDTEEFCAAIYTECGGEEYARVYASFDDEAYKLRVHSIYKPKVQFLIDALIDEGLEPRDLTYTDLAAGSGYIVTALLEAGVREVTGFEVSDAQVSLANRMIGGSLVKKQRLNELEEIVQKLDADVVSMIGALEHFRQPRAVLHNLRANSKVRYLFLSLPLFSPSVFFEMVFPDVMPRHLTKGHTHLFTESSIQWLCQEFGLKRVSEWWFGTDLVDLYRCVSIELSRYENTQDMVEQWRELFLPVLDAMQLQMDRRKLSSQVHVVLKVSN